MNYKKLLLFNLLLLSFASHSSLKAFDFSHFSKMITPSSIVKATGVAAGVYIGYTLINYVYTQIKEHYENQILNEMVDALIVSVIPATILQEELSPAEYEDALKKKSRIIAMRKRIIKKLEEILKNQKFSDKQYKKMKGDVALAKISFGFVDLIREKNKFENHEHIITFLDNYIEDQIIATYILMSKPQEECTQTELQERALKTARKQKIIQLLKNKLEGNLERFVIQAMKLINLVMSN